MKMKQLKTRNIISFILAFAMVMSVFFSPLANTMVKAAEPQVAVLKTGKIDTSHGTGKYLVYFSNTAELAANCAWYSGIYNGTNKTSAYLTGKVQVGGENYTAQIWAPGDQGTSGLIRFDVNTTSDFIIPAGTIFTYTNDTNQKIVFEQEYLFDMSLGMVYPTDVSGKNMTIAKYSWGKAKMGFTIGNVADLPNEWQPENLSSVEANFLKFRGEVQVATATGTETKTVELGMPNNGEIWFYFEAAGITTGIVTVSKDSLFYPVNGMNTIKFPRAYTIDVDNTKLTHEQEIIELNAFSFVNAGERAGVNVARQDELKNVGWYTKTGTTESDYNTAVGNIVNENGETKQIEIKVVHNGELWFRIGNVAEKTITISKDTVFQSTGVNYPYKTVFSFKFASDYVIDIANQKVIHKENIGFNGYNWKNKDLMNVGNGASSFNELEWYQKIQNKASDKETIKATGIAKDYAGNDVNVTIQIQDQGLITCWYNNVKDTRITIPAGTIFKTATVSTSTTNNLKKQYEFTFTEACELDAATKYVGPVNGQTGAQGDANADSVVGVADLVHMKRFVNAMEDSAVPSINGWQVGYGADVNVDGSYNVNDIQPLKTVLLTGSYAVSSVLVANGATDYSIVTFNTPSDNEIFAAEELQYFIKESTNVTIPIIKEVETTEDGKYIYIGATYAAEKAGVTPTYEEVQNNGFQIATEKQNIYIRGYSELGTRNGVYQFLEDNFDYECYAADEIGLIPKDRVAIAADYDKVVVPSFDWRQANYGELVYEDGVITNTTLSKRMRFNHADEIFVTGHSYHNSFELIRPDTYYAEHPDWFYTKAGETEPTQLCYSKALTDDAMFTVYFDNVKKNIQKNNVPNMMVGIQDTTGWCNCDGCTDSYNTYQAHSAIVIQFVNKLQKAVNDWYATTYPGKQPTRLVFFAYHDTIDPPVKTGDATKDALITLNENSAVMFAPSGAKIDESYASQEAVTAQLDGWKEVTDNVYIWTYSLIMDNALLFVDTIDFMLPNYQLWSGNGVSFMLDQTEHYQQHGNSGFSRLKMYLMSKLQWDCTITEAELEVLIDEFFENYFGEASQVMKALYEAESTKLKTIYETVALSIGGDLVSTDYWSQDELAGYLNSIDQAYSAIAELETSNPERYEQLYERILLESMQFRYLMLNLYPAYYGDGLQNARTQFQTDFEALKLTRLAESTKTDRDLKEKMDFYLTETLTIELSTTKKFSIWDDQTIGIYVANHSSLSSNTDSIYCTATVFTEFYGDIIVDGVKVEDARFDIPPLSGNTSGVLAMRDQTSFTTIQIPAGTELRTADGLYKVVFDKTYIINYTNKTVTKQ